MKRWSRIAWLLALLLSIACSFFSSVIPSPTSVVTPALTTGAPSTSLPLPALEGVIAYASSHGNVHQIVAMNADGSDEVSLTSSSGAYSRPSWSPNGRQLAVRMEIEMGSGLAVMDVYRENGKLLGAPPLPLVKAFADGPRWSPDGTQLVYVTAGDGGGWTVYIWDLATASSRSVPGIPEHSTDPDWSPDGSQIVFSNYTDPSYQFNDLYVVNTDGSGFTQLTNTPTLSEDEPIWSPDGQKIVFTAFDGDSGNFKTDIFIMNRDGSNTFRVTTDAGSDFDPSWSPDGKQIVFVSDRHENNDGNYEVYVINADGTGELRLTNNRSTDRWPTWRAKQPDDVLVADCQPGITLVGDVTIPAGTRFATPQPFSKIWRLKNSGTCTWTPTNYMLRFVDGEQMVDITQVMVPGAIQPGATVDLAIPFVASEAPGRHVSLWKLVDRDGNAVSDIDGSPVTLVVDIEVLPPNQALLPKPLYFLSDQSGSTQIWRMETDARTVAQITSEPQPVVTLAVSSATGKIAYVSQDQLILADANGQNRQVVANLDPDARARRLAWSADGNRLAYASQGIHIYDASTGKDRLLIADKDTQAPDLARYEPLEWSPDGSKLTATKYLWESAGINVISTSDGAVLFDQAQQSITWNRDSQSVYLSSSYYSEWTGTESGLWRGLLTGEAPQALIQGASIWLPVQRGDGTLAFFMHQPTTRETKEYTPLLYVSAADGSNPVAARTWPILITLNDTFDGVWTDDGQAILVQLVRPALDISEVLLLSVDENPPLFLTSEIKAFWWGK